MIVVTGAAGHIGNVLIRELLKQNKGLIRALVLPDEDLTSLQGLDVTLVKGNVLDLDSLVNAFTGADLVFHLASIIAISRGTEKLVEQVNVTGTRNVIKACKECNVKRLVYTSSVHALFEPPKGTTITEECGFHPKEEHAIYERTKAQASADVLQAAQEGLDTVIVCPSGVTGPYDFRDSEMGALLQAYVKKQIVVYVDGGYDYVDVRDVALGHIAAAERGKRGETYLLSGEYISVLEIFKELQIITGIKYPRFKMPYWMLRMSLVFTPTFYKLTKQKPLFTRYSVQTLRSNADISNAKARRELGFNPRPVRESIRDHFKWLNENGKLPKLSTTQL